MREMGENGELEAQNLLVIRGLESIKLCVFSGLIEQLANGKLL